MTPELKAAVDRARRAYDDLFAAYGVVDDGSAESLCTLHALVQADLRRLAEVVRLYGEAWGGHYLCEGLRHDDRPTSGVEARAASG